MATKAGHSDASSAAAKQGPMELLNIGQGRAEAMLSMQKELLGAYEQVSRAWLERVKAEVDLWLDLARRISAANSLPDALGAYQQCVAQRMQMATEDGRRLVEDSQKMMSTITQAMSKGLPAGST